VETGLCGAVVYGEIITTNRNDMNVHRINPEALGPALGPYSQLSTVPALGIVNIAGQLAAGATFTEQCDGVFAAIGHALEAAGSTWADVLGFTTYIVSPDDIDGFKKWRTEHFPALFGEDYPPNTLLVVRGLCEEQFLIEVQTIAVTTTEIERGSSK
jgi:enamine deaminase RidA (YjgF/YER057c/UK114 family)